jgi:hypothetical protein
MHAVNALRRPADFMCGPWMHLTWFAGTSAGRPVKGYPKTIATNPWAVATLLSFLYKINFH